MTPLWSEVKRKFFHLAGLGYVVALILVPRPLYLAVLAMMLAAVFLMEMVRLKNERVNRWFMTHCGGLFRNEEHSRFSGLFWMLLGVTGTVLLAEPLPIAAAALLYLILGDGVASLTGMRFGGPHWPGSSKRLSGSLACFLVCLFVGFVLLRDAYGGPTVVAGAVAATLIERGFVAIDDNVSIPIGSALVLLLCARLLT